MISVYILTFWFIKKAHKVMKFENENVPLILIKYKFILKNTAQTFSKLEGEKGFSIEETASCLQLYNSSSLLDK